MRHFLIVSITCSNMKTQHHMHYTKDSKDKGVKPAINRGLSLLTILIKSNSLTLVLPLVLTPSC